MASITIFLVLLSFLTLNQLYPSLGQNVKAAYWFPESEFPLTSIDSRYFTHLFSAFANLDPNTNQLVISPQNQDSFSKFTTTVQQKNPSVKTLISIGGGSADQSVYASMASQAGRRKTFIDSSIKLARKYGFHGLDMDWEYPTNTTQMTNFGKLIDEWRVAVAAEAKTSNKVALLLTAAVSFGSKVDGWLSYPYPSIAKSLDWINVMAYDFYAPTRPSDEGATHAHASLNDPNSQISGNSGIEDWIKAGVPANKLVLGLPFYGYGWELVDPDDHGIGSPANGQDGTGDGSYGYNQIRDFIADTGAGMVFDSTYVTDYCYSETTWIGYDDVQSVKTKVLYAKKKTLRGYFAWHVGSDYNWELSKTAKQAWP